MRLFKDNTEVPGTMVQIAAKNFDAFVIRLQDGTKYRIEDGGDGIIITKVQGHLEIQPQFHNRIWAK